MPPALHRVLKRDLDLDGPTIHPDDLLEDLPLIDPSSYQQVAKRRRIESIALQYLSRGKTPLILSAGLRGPFDNGWNNPWANQTKPKEFSRGSLAEDPGNQFGGHSKNRTGNIGRLKKVKTIGETQSKRMTRSPSPETSRAVRMESNLSQQDHDQVVTEVPLATAPFSENTVSGGTLFHSMDTVTSNKERSQLANPFWIRRPDSQDRGNMGSIQPANLDSSPTRTRSQDTNLRKKIGETLKIGPPRAPIPPCKPVSQIGTPIVGMVHASGSTLVSSPVKESNAEQHKFAGTVIGETMSSEDCNQSQVDMDCHVPSATLHSTSSLYTQCRLAQARPKSPHDKDTSTSQIGLRKCVIETSIAGCLKQRPKPRAVDFDSPPSMVKKPADPDAMGLKTSENVEKEVLITNLSAQSQDASSGQSIGDEVGTNSVEPADADSQSEQSNCDSAMSTQAAMMLAQFEFQQSSCPVTSPDHRRPWSQAKLDVFQNSVPVLSPAMTPLSVFNDGMDKPALQASAVRGPPMSTQDLFGAASPFAFSTVKKKTDASRQLTNLVLSTNVKVKEGFKAPSKSPTPSCERIPLKAKNTSAPFWASLLDKASQASQESSMDISKRFTSDVELPQLDLRTSLDEYGPNGDLRFADRFLHELANT